MGLYKKIVAMKDRTATVVFFAFSFLLVLLWYMSLLFFSNSKYPLGLLFGLSIVPVLIVSLHGTLRYLAKKYSTRFSRRWLGDKSLSRGAICVALLLSALWVLGLWSAIEVLLKM